MLVTLNLPDSIMDDTLTTIEDQFTVYIKDPCADNSLTLTNQLGDQFYWIADPAQDVSSKVTQTVDVSICPLDKKLEYWDELDRIWRDFSDFASANHG